MKRPVLIALFMALMLSLSAASALAEPGCDKSGASSMMTVLKNHGNAQRVRDRAYTRQIVKRNDPSLGVSCFDKALAVTSRLGSIFSDVKEVTPSLFMNTTIFTGIDLGSGIGSVLGTDNLLATNLNKMVNPVLGDYLNDFIGTLSEILGVNAISSMLSDVTSFITGYLDDFNTAVDAVLGTITTLQDALDTVYMLADQFELPLPSLSIISVLYPALLAAQSIINAAISSILTIINTAVSTLMSQLQSLIMGPMVNLNCDHITNLWDDGNDGGGADSIEGNGIQKGSPYFDFASLAGGSPAGVVEDMLQELGVPSNAALLTKAKSDLTGLLNAPGSMPLWKTPVIFNAGTTVDDIVAEW